MLCQPIYVRSISNLKSAGKRIFAVSDMYLPKQQMKQLLEKAGYDGLEDIIVSCDYFCNKSSGGLFKVLKNKVGFEKTIVHIGDNWNADIEGARKEHIDARYYCSCRNLGNVHRCEGMSALIRSAYDGIINTTLHNGLTKYTLPWEYGFCYGGLVTLGYANWIFEQAKVDKVDKILFVARDGYTVKKVFDSIHSDIPSEYIYWSRLASLACISDNDRYYFLRRNIFELENGTSTVSECLDMMGLNQLAGQCKTKCLPMEMPLTNDNKLLLCDYIAENWNEVMKILSANKQAMISYLRKLIEKTNTIAIVDIGWSAQNLIPLLKMIQEGLKIQAFVYMLGSRNVMQTPVKQLDGTIKCYMFASHYNRLIFDRVLKEKNNLIMESLFFAPQCSFEKRNKNGEFLFIVPEIENHNVVNEMSDGILEFCDKYIALCNKFPGLLQISGYDSFIPIRSLLNHKNYVKLAVPNLKTNMKLSNSNDDKRVAFADIFLTANTYDIGCIKTINIRSIVH